MFRGFTNRMESGYLLCDVVNLVGESERTSSSTAVYLHLRALTLSFLQNWTEDSCPVTLPSFEIDNEHATPSFLAAYFMNSRVWSDFSAESIGLGSRRQRVNQKRLLEQRLLLPPMALQRIIEDVLEKYQNNAPVNEGRDAAVLMLSEMRNIFSDSASPLPSSVSGTCIARYISSNGASASEPLGPL